jgi:outer membrane immunogenic protein
MRSLALLIATAGAVVIAASGAEAQGLGSGFSGRWTGAYVGAQVDLLSTKSLESATAMWAPSLLADMGGGGGVFAGYDYQLNNMFVAGVLGEYNLDSTQLVYNGKAAGTAQWDASIAGRLGTPLASNVLAYGSVGYEWGHFDYTDRFAGPTYGNANFTTGGLQFGLGVDAMLTSNIMARFEATYTHYDSNIISQNGSPYWQSTPSMIAIKGGLGFKFD